MLFRSNDFVLHVKWSSDPKVGFIELYHDGKIVIPKKYVATQFSGQRNYLKMGLYRDASISPEGIVYHDGFTQATSLEDVMPTPSAVASAPVTETPSAPGASTDAASSPEGTSVANPELGPPDEDGATQSPTGTTALGTAGLTPDPAAAPVAASCGASATGGAPLLLLAALSMLVLNTRRKTPARVTARARPTSRP